MKFVLLFSAIIITSLSIYGETQKNKNGFLEVKPNEFTCISITSQCSICSDGKKRIKKGKSYTVLDLSDYSCAKNARTTTKIKGILPTASAKLGHCVPLSDFCAICKNGSFISTQSGNKIDSDLFECATSPRTKQF